MESSRLKTLLLVLILAMASGGAWLYGQAPQAEILGSVVDATGAAVPGASVVLTNEASGVKNNTLTTSSGDYTFVYLDPGTYTVTVEKEGFETAVYAGNKVQVLEKKRVDVQLKVGQVTTKVEVTGEAAKVDTDTAEVGSTVSNREVLELPLNGREFSELAVLMPGVQAAGTTGQCGITAGLTFATAVRISGGSGYGCAGGGSDKYTYDGVDNTWTLVGGPGINPSIDSIQEFRIDRSQMQAEFGMGANQIELVTKTGGNQFHGALWEYNRNAATEAGQYYSHVVAPLNRNQYGGDVGGPIKKDKAFFFFNWEGQKQVSSTVEQGTEMTPLQRSGNLSELSALGSSYQAHDPFTGLAYAGNVIPTALQNPVSLSLMNTYLPIPNLPGLVSNTLVTFPVIDDWHQGIARLDWNISTKDRLNIRFSGEPRSPLAAGLDASSVPAEAITYYVNTGIAWQRNWNATTLTEVRAGYSGNKVDVGSVPLKAYAPLTPYAPGSYSPAVPGYLWMNPFGVHMSSWWYPEDYYMHSIDMVANLTKIHGAHTMKFGFERRTHSWNNVAGPGPKEEIAFNGEYTGVGVADFLEGYPDESDTEGYGDFVNRANLGQPWTDFYGQDDWKVNSRLTVNLGLRWDLMAPHAGRNDLLTTFDLNTGQAVVAGSELSPQFTNQAVVAAHPTLFTTAAAVGWPTTTMIWERHDNISPRVGFAWRPWKGNKTVVRGGYGKFFQSFSDVNEMYYQIQSPYEAGANSMVNTKPFPTRTINDPYALQTGLAPPVPPLTDFYWDAHEPNANMQQMNIGMEHELVGGLIVEGNIQFQHTIHEENGYDYNESPLGSNVTPYPEFTATASNNYSRLGIVDNAWTRYTALELEVRKSARHYTFMLSNVWAKEINGSPGRYGNYFPGPGNYIPDELKLNFVVDVPFGKGRQFLNHGGVVDAVVGGWETGSIMILHQGGDPLSVSTYNNYTNDNQDDTGNPNRVCSGRVSSPTIHEWINPACFVAPTAPSWGNSGTGILFGPGRSMIGDWSLYKNFTLHEQMKLQVRGELFNVFNHPYNDDPNTSWPSPGVFGTISSRSLTPRVVQFALRFTF